jgi:hypothetical protein
MNQKIIKRVLLVLPILLFVCFARNPTKESLRAKTKTFHPNDTQLEPGYNSFVKRAFSEDNIEYGIIAIKDGTKVKYWFKSHHLVDDSGGTWFELPDRKMIYMVGGFCCEVQFPEEGFKTVSDLKRFIQQRHGRRP